MAVNEPALNVLISSKQKEFAEERAAIRALMAPLPLLVADAAEEWGPGADSIRERFLQQARSCALYVGLFGCVYSPPTIEEYRTAAENPYREILVYIKKCSGRDPELGAFLKQVTDPESGRTTAEYTTWDQVEPIFARHLWAAIQRMITRCLELGQKQVSLSGGDGVLERRRRSYERALAQIGYPSDAEEAALLADKLRRFVPGGRFVPGE
jgi:hypothetical protein